MPYFLSCLSAGHFKLTTSIILINLNACVFVFASPLPLVDMSSWLLHVLNDISPFCSFGTSFTWSFDMPWVIPSPNITNVFGHTWMTSNNPKDFCINLLYVLTADSSAILDRVEDEVGGWWRLPVQPQCQIDATPSRQNNSYIASKLRLVFVLYLFSSCLIYVVSAVVL